MWQCCAIGCDDDNRAKQVQNALQRHDFLSHFGYPLDATYQHTVNQRRKSRCQKPVQAVQQREGLCEDFYRLIGLKHIPAAQRAAEAEDSKKKGKGATKMWFS